MNRGILDRLVRRGNRYFDLDGSVTVGRIDEFSNPGSTTCRVELLIGGHSRALYVKTLIPGRGVTERIKEDVAKEYDVLSTLYDGFAGEEHLAVVRPLAVFPEDRTIVTREAPGPTLQQRLAGATRIWASRRDFESAGRFCYLAGKWLNRFQQLTYKGKAVFTSDNIRHYCDVRLSDLVARPASGIDESLRHDVLGWVDVMSRQAEHEENVVAGCHNDYAPHNMIAGDDSLCVLDLGFFNYDSTVYDVCRFWHRLQTFREDPLVSGRRIREYQERFLAGYGHPVDRAAGAFRLAECRFVLSSMCTLLKGHAGSFPRRQLNAYVYNRYLVWLKREVGNN